jgi:PKD repeat protein
MSSPVYKKVGTGTWTVPTGVTQITFRLCAGGPGGGGGWTWGTNYGMGLSAEYSYTPSYTISVTPGAVMPYTVGDGGAGGPHGTDHADTTRGQLGGPTTFAGYTQLSGLIYGDGNNDGVGQTTPGQDGQSSGFTGDGLGESSWAACSYSGAKGIGYGASGPGASSDGSGGKGAPGLLMISYLEPPVASFTRLPISGNEPLTVQFTDTSTNTPTEWEWNFGDGSTAITKNPAHIFTTPSSTAYTVTLRAKNAAGWGDYFSLTVAVGYVAPVASFTAVPTSGYAPHWCNFTDTTTHFPTTWLWQYNRSGAGWVTFSTLKNPNNNFSVIGVYLVRLTATNPSGSSTSASTTITVSATLGAAFSIRERSITQLSPFDSGGTKIKLYDKSVFSGSGAKTWNWTLSSAGYADITSTLQNPEITLPQITGVVTRVWSVSLYVTNYNDDTSATVTLTNAVSQRVVMP